MKKLILVFALTGIALVSNAQSKSFEPIFSTKEGAIRGYDPVAYFTQGKPVKGEKNISLDWGGGTWHFANLANRDSFSLSPEKYAPVYGGYCAYGWAKGYPAKTEPGAWSIVGDKVYLNYNAEVKADWDKKQAEYIKTANSQWERAVKRQTGKD